MTREPNYDHTRDPQKAIGVIIVQPNVIRPKISPITAEHLSLASRL